MTVGLKRPANILTRRVAAVATLALLASIVTLPLAAPASATAPECGLPVVAGTTEIGRAHV